MIVDLSQRLEGKGVLIPGSEEPGATPIIRNPYTPRGPLVDHNPDNHTASLYDSFQKSLLKHPHNPFLGHRPYDPYTNTHKRYYEWQTYEQVSDRVDRLGAGLIKLIGLEGRGWRDEGAEPKRPWFSVGIYSCNRPEWVITDIASWSHSLVSVALYDTLGVDTVEYILNHSHLPVVVCSAAMIANLLLANAPELKLIVCMDEWWWPREGYQLSTMARQLLENAKAAGIVDPPVPAASAQELPSPQSILKKWAEKKGVKLMTFREVEAVGAANMIPHRPSQPDELYTVCYTSGTTGVPKGAMLTHRNFSVISCLGMFPGVDLNSQDTHVSYLPLAHCFERTLVLQLMSVGGRVGFYHGDTLGLFEDMAILKPTIFISVPRLWNRIYSKIRSATLNAGGLKGALFSRAVAEKLRNLPKHGPKHAFWDPILFDRVKAILGGRVRLMITGSAPISTEVMQFLRICFCAEIMEGFGSTENAAAATISFPGDYSAGHIGVPMPCCEIKLVDVPEMNYKSSDRPFPRGEICIRGPNVFAGYWDAPEKTSEAKDDQGWLHTGDIAALIKGNKLKIVDRKKNIFKLAQGEYVAPEKVENIYVQCPLVAQAWVYGDSLQSSTVVVVVPNMETFPSFVRQVTGDKDADAARAANERAVRKALLKEMNELGRKCGLVGFELAKKVFVDLVPFTPERGLVTPTFKLKRPQLKDIYHREVNDMYAELNTGDHDHDGQIPVKL